MKHKIFTISLLVFLIACNKTETPVLTPVPTPVPTTGDIELENINDYFILSIAFDSKGTAWLGTFSDGLIKYNPDGSGLIYNSSNSVLSDGVIRDIEVDSEDNVWIGEKGLLKFDGDSFTLFNSSNTDMPYDVVWSIAIDNDDYVWFTSCHHKYGGLVKYDGVTCEVFTTENSDLPDNLIHSIINDNDNNIWLAIGGTVNNSYLVKISNNNWQVYNTEELGYNVYYFENIACDSENTIYSAIDYTFSSTWHYNRPQIFVYNGVSIDTLMMDSTSFSIRIKIDNQDNLLCTNGTRLGTYSGSDWEIDDSTFTDKCIFTMEQAPDGKMWFGLGEGIYIKD